jgi:hypothetical protein
MYLVVAKVFYFSLRDYMKDVLQMESEEWQQISTPTINDHVELSHLQSLYMGLEEKLHGSPLDHILSVYREPLDESQRSTLVVLNDSEASHLKVLHPILRDFMTDQLVSSQWSPSASLKEYLSYLNCWSDEEIDWFTNHFPDIFALRHAFSLFQWLSDLLKGS